MLASATLDSIDRPIVALSDEYAPGFVDPLHAHRRNQLIYATSGVMAVSTNQGSYVVPPGRAVWVPAGTHHEVSCSGSVSLRTLYVEPAVSKDLPTGCCVFQICTLLHALILESMTFEREYDVHGREGRIVRLLLEELSSRRLDVLQVPMPIDRRLLRMCQTMMSDLAVQTDLDELAALAMMGRRTMTRRFRQETGISIATWRQQIRLAAAVARLANGSSVTSVCYEVGYDSLSAFTTVFHKAFGVPPGLYAARLRRTA